MPNPSTDGSRRRRRRHPGAVVAPVVVALLVACGASALHADRVADGSTAGVQTMATSAATVAAEENGFLAAVRPSHEVIARVAGVPIADDGVLLFLGYAVCRGLSASGKSRGGLERDAAGTAGGAPLTETDRTRRLVVRAARATICG